MLFSFVSLFFFGWDYTHAYDVGRIKVLPTIIYFVWDAKIMVMDFFFFIYFFDDLSTGLGLLVWI